MTRRLLSAIALGIALGAILVSNPPPAVLHRTTMGLIQHRGQFYRFEDLMSPEYRAQSDDSFVRSFADEQHFAVPWAGKGDDRDTLDDLEMRRTDIWRNQVTTIDIHSEQMIGIPWAGDGPRQED